MSSGSRVPMIPVERWRVCDSGVPRACARKPAIAAWSRSPGAPVAAFAEPLVEIDAGRPAVPAVAGGLGRREVRLRQADGRGRERVRGEDRGRRGRLPLAVPPAFRRDDREVRPARRLDPGDPARGDEAGRDRRPRRSTAGSVRRQRRERGAASRSSSSTGFGCYGRQRQLLETERLGQAVDEVERLDRLARGALDEVVDHADREDPAGPRVVADERRGRGCCRGRASSPAARRRPSRTARRRRPRGTARRAPPGSTGRVGRTWQADRIPRVIGIRCGRNVDRAVRSAPSAASSCSISADVAMAVDAVRLHALVDLAEHQVRLRVAAGARDAALRVDDEVVDQAGPGERRDREEGRRRVAARVADDRDVRVAEGGELGRGGMISGRP